LIIVKLYTRKTHGFCWSI